MSELVYCLKCKKKCECEKVGGIVITKNNRHMQKYECKLGHKVCRFVKKPKKE
jgi:hypothetical protein